MFWFKMFVVTVVAFFLGAVCGSIVKKLSDWALLSGGLESIQRNDEK